MRSAVLHGALWANVLTFPIAAICALVYRFPIPLAGYQSGPGAMAVAPLAVLFYGIFGGFLALFVAGGFGGAVAYAIAKPDKPRVRRITLAFAALIAVLGVGFLAMLDKLIGPW